MRLCMSLHEACLMKIMVMGGSITILIENWSLWHPDMSIPLPTG